MKSRNHFPYTTIRCRARAGLYRVVVITPEEALFRSYPAADMRPDEAMLRALASTGTPAAWTPGELPTGDSDKRGKP